MNQVYGLSHLWSQGDAIARAVALILLAMSITSWVVIVLKALQLRQQRRHARAAQRFWDSPDFDAALQRLGDSNDNPFHRTALDGRQAAAHLSAPAQSPKGALHESLDLSDWVSRALDNAIDDATARLQSGLPVLASIGSTAPFVGLFGTVWGIYHALLGIGAAGSASIDQVAGPIGEALIMTAFGLAVAIPAVLGYNALLRGNKAVVHQLRRFAHDLHAYFITGARMTQRGSPGTPSH